MLIADTQKECITKLKAWKAGMESKGLPVNMKKTKFMVSAVDLDILQKSGKYPCAVCCKGVGNNSIECLQCKAWVHKRCSGITGRLVNVRNNICPRVKDNSRPIGGRPMTQVDVEGTKLDVEDTLLSGWHAVLWWGLWQCHCLQMLCGLGKVYETIACPHLQAPVS